MSFLAQGGGGAPGHYCLRHARSSSPPAPPEEEGPAAADGRISSLSDHVLHSGEGHLHPGLQRVSDLPYNRKHNSLPLQVSSRNE